MRKIKTSDITTGVGMPIKSGTLDQLQLAYQEALDALAKLNVGLSANDSTNYHVLYGCVNSGSGTSYVISAGAIYYNGEIYLTSAQNITTTGSNVVVGTITTTFNTTNADPVTFTDSSSKNVHEIRKIVWSNASSGSGNVNFSSIKYYTYQFRGNVGNTGMYFLNGTGTFGSQQTLDYKRIGDSVFLQYGIKITPATYTSGYLTIVVPLPVGVGIDPNTFAGNICYAEIDATMAISAGKVLVLNSSSPFSFVNVMIITIYGSATTAISITGQIMYKAQ